MESPGEPTEEPKSVGRLKELLGRIRRPWAILFAILGIALVVRLGVEYRMSVLNRGDDLAKEVAGLAEQAKRARDVKDIDAARSSLAQTITILRDADQFKSHPIYVSTLIDMGALLLSNRTPVEGDIIEGRTLLAEAWEIAKGLDARTRWRIARDLGLASVLAGDMAEAEKWYSTATELVPDDKVSRERLDTLRSVKKWK